MGSGKRRSKFAHLSSFFSEPLLWRLKAAWDLAAASPTTKPCIGLTISIRQMACLPRSHWFPRCVQLRRLLFSRNPCRPPRCIRCNRNHECHTTHSLPLIHGSLARHAISVHSIQHLGIPGDILKEANTGDKSVSPEKVRIGHWLKACVC